MYIPQAFQENRREVLLPAIAACAFGSLITVGGGEIMVSHIPFIPSLGDDGADLLLGHLARSNPQWRVQDEPIESVASFMLDEAYISPSWYPSKAATGRVVPTWSYVAIEVRGVLEVVDDTAEALAIVDRLTSRHEADRPVPWASTDAPPDYISGHLRGIVGFKLRIRTIVGAWKLGQNKSAADRLGVADGLSHDPRTAALSARMRAAG